MRPGTPGRSQEHADRIQRMTEQNRTEHAWRIQEHAGRIRDRSRGGVSYEKTEFLRRTHPGFQY